MKDLTVRMQTLDELDLSQVAPGDELTWYPVGEQILNAEGETVYFFDPDGKPFPGDTIAQAKAFEAIYNPYDRDVFMKDALGLRGIQVIVHTSYLGANHAHFGGPPLIWESMISGQGEWSDFQFRYCTRNAARIGHATIVDALKAFGMTPEPLPAPWSLDELRPM